MVAEYGDYVYNHHLFHFQDGEILDERELVWECEAQMIHELGARQVKLKSRTAMFFFCGIILIALGCAAIVITALPADFPGHEDRPMYATVVLMGTGIALCLGGLLLLTSMNNKIIFYERGFKYVDLFGLRRQTVMYRDIRYIEKHRVRTTRAAFDSYVIHVNGKKYNWMTNEYIGAEAVTDLLLFKCFQNVSTEKERRARLNTAM